MRGTKEISFIYKVKAGVESEFSASFLLLWSESLFYYITRMKDENKRNFSHIDVTNKGRIHRCSALNRVFDVVAVVEEKWNMKTGIIILFRSPSSFPHVSQLQSYAITKETRLSTISISQSRKFLLVAVIGIHILCVTVLPVSW